MRRGIIPLVIGHVIVGCVGMAFVSIATFVAQFIYIALLYSVYMTLRTWLIWVYMILLGLNVISGVLQVFMEDGAAFIVYLIILILYCFAILKIKTDSESLRNMTYDENGGSTFYLENGIRHMVNTAKVEYARGNNDS